MLLNSLRRLKMGFWTDFKDACQDVADGMEEHKSLIFLISGLALGVTAAVVAVANSKEAYAKLEEKHEQDEENEVSKPMQIATDIVAVAPNYAFPIVLALIAGGLLIKSYTLNMAEIGTLGTALAIAQKKNQEYEIYKQKVRESVGKSKEEKIAHEVTKEQIRQDPPPKDLILTGDGKMLMKNLNTGSYFRSTPEEIRRVETLITHRCYTQEFTKLSEFLYELDVMDNSASAELFGWPMGAFPDISFEPVLMDDGVTTVTGVRFFRDEDEILGYITQNNY